MKLGVMLDYAVTGSDRAGLRDYVQAIEDLGIDFVTVPEQSSSSDISTARPW